MFKQDGFVATVIYEDDYDLIIEDRYFAVNSRGKYKVAYYARVKYSGDKDEITFEDLEGRRHYLKNTCEKFIAFTDFKYTLLR